MMTAESKDSLSSMSPLMKAYIDASAARSGFKLGKNYAGFTSIGGYKLLSILEWRLEKHDFLMSTEIAVASRVLQTLLTRPTSEIYGPPRSSIEESFGTLKVQQQSTKVKEFIERVSTKDTIIRLPVASLESKPLVARSSGPSSRKRKYSDYDLPARPVKRIRDDDSMSATAQKIEARLKLAPNPFQRSLASSLSKAFSRCALEIALREGLRFLRRNEAIIRRDYMDVFEDAFKQQNSAELLETSTVLKLEMLDFIGILKVMKAGLLKFSFLGDSVKISDVLGMTFYARNLDAHAPSGGLTDLQINHIMDSVLEFLDATGCNAAVWDEYDTLKVKVVEGIGET
ncbi:hypothetical protein BCR33DRAFT_850729 [Rhizoclosmatium globosum]|uniref:Uncharacterized protein n=1 Tax=Rhizoclosmatium globosum TaxID=329046 RepID=A0A1Y2CB59_9FUNG|nr:hypothetical protein BCR33DRAFT_850729 [Rhizoclosmatium globosum]|eukprot:ORY44084.1 hypothetical protein BCR33DRAFT_850729 [Rhizoclosmatium globosum]